MPGTDLLEALLECGEALPESHKPSPATSNTLLAGLLYWLETGSTEPPVSEAPEPSPLTAQEARIEELEAELASTRSKVASQSLPPSPVAPPAAQPGTATAPVPAEQPGTVPSGAPVAEPVGETSADVSPQPPVPPAPPVSEVPSEPTS